MTPADYDDLCEAYFRVVSNLPHKDKTESLWGALRDLEPLPDDYYDVGGIETIDFIEAKHLSFRLGNVVKYIARADYKGDPRGDLHKALWYLQREIEKRGFDE
jgi:hypothetical protein